MYCPEQMKGYGSWYWSSSAIEDYGASAWVVVFVSGHVYYSSVSNLRSVRCVR